MVEGCNNVVISKELFHYLSHPQGRGVISEAGLGTSCQKRKFLKGKLKFRIVSHPSQPPCMTIIELLFLGTRQSPVLPFKCYVRSLCSDGR